MQFTLENIWEYSLEICNKDTVCGNLDFSFAHTNNNVD